MRIDVLKTPKANLIDLINLANATDIVEDDFEFEQLEPWSPVDGINDANTTITIVALPISGYLDKQQLYYRRIDIQAIRPEETLTYEYPEDEPDATKEDILLWASDYLQLCPQPLVVSETWPELSVGEQAFITLYVEDDHLLYHGTRLLKLRKPTPLDASTPADGTVYG